MWGTLGTLACLTAAAFATTAPAQAAPASAPVSVQAAAAEPPSVWPKPAKIVHVPNAAAITCESGNLCVAAYDATKGDHVVYYLYYCTTYELSNFVGTGSYRNQQTGGATARFYGQSGNLLTSVPAGGSSNAYNWNPVWSIRNC
ncbi:hypothetical protein SLINC_4390 [Streptomyces lincolnensis]|uniref:Uncharacterized protein n=1 Tax=Streptomyces lincolnensis TaxID=1915 RepID=A0A1B1MDH1_STRLN|nr:hypothetical protein [Streptomyces lincolnensis]ANS66614.1 hypothetical protein SLINC_4390 [Streptomyces lincolnensis]QMV08016.1 hypothetical protein GJU35_21730 [Streptomyces lincolnensis]